MPDGSLLFRTFAVYFALIVCVDCVDYLASFRSICPVLWPPLEQSLTRFHAAFATVCFITVKELANE